MELRADPQQVNARGCDIWRGCPLVLQSQLATGHTALDIARSKVSEYLDFQVQWMNFLGTLCGKATSIGVDIPTSTCDNIW